MNVLLAFPPFTDACQPSAAIPSLAAALRQDGVDVEVVDANLEAWEWLLDAPRQRRWLRRATSDLARLESRPRLRRRDRARYVALADGWLRGAASHAEIPDALRTLRASEFYEPERYARAVRAVEGALALASAVHHPTRMTWGRCFPGESVESSAGIARAVRAPDNPFARFARDVFGARLRASRPSIVGLSITYLDQVIPAFTLAAECRRVAPDALVVIGGQIPSAWGAALAAAAPLWRLADAFVLGDGESALRRIVQACAARAPLTGIPNVLTVDGPAATVREDVASLPCPDYRGLPLERYLAPEPVLTLSASRGCYWGRCAFCAVSPAFRGAWRTRSADRVRADLRLLWERHGARHFTFGDDALPPRVAADLARTGHGVPAPVRWQAELRWDALPTAQEVAALGRAGAANLVFGFESGSDAALARMRKGARIDQALAIVKACTREGIGVNLQCFAGFPGETRRDVARTVAFLERTRAPRVTVSCGVFELQKGSPIWAAPDEFGVRLRRPGPARDLALRFDYTPRRSDAATEVIRRRFTSRTPQLRCGINAHALLWLSRPAAPVTPRSPARPRLAEPLAPAAGSARRLFAWDPYRLGAGARRPTWYAYGAATGRLVSLSQVAAAAIAACDGATVTRELLAPLAPNERRRVRRALARLAEAGLVASADPFPPGGPRSPRRVRLVPPHEPVPI